MERRRNSKPRTRASRIDLPDDEVAFDFSSLPTSKTSSTTVRSSSALCNPWAPSRLLGDADNVAMLRRRKDKSLKQLLARLDLAIGRAMVDDVYTDGVNPTTT